MRKTILTLSFLTLVLSTFAIGPFTIGLKAGINSNKVTTDNTTVSNFTSPGKSGYDVGVFARFGKKVYLQPEVLYCVINGYSTSGTSSSQTVKLNTIQIPVLLGFKVIDLKLASLRIFTGPAMSYVTTKSITSIPSNILSGNDFKNSYWDWQAGAGIDIGMLTLDVRYGFGITKLSDTANSYTNNGKVITMSIGFKFI